MSRKKRLLEKVNRRYGCLPDREYSEDELKKIKAYFEFRKEDKETFIDDITWNDMDMDMVFIAMNHTYSSAGEEALYDILRTPVFDRAELSERERLIRYFSGNQEVRGRVQADFAMIGRTRKYSIVQYISQFRNMRLKPDYVYILHAVLLLAAILTAVVSPLLGVLVILFAMGYNIAMYYKNKGQIEAYYQSLAAMAYVVDGAKSISGEKSEELKRYTDELKQELKYVSSLSASMTWLDNKQAGSGDILQIVLDYVRMVTHFDFIVFNHMVKKVRNNEDHLLRIIEIMGYLESMIAIASYRETAPFYCNPEFTDGNTGISADNLYHPLLKEAVANSFSEEKPVLLTGSNASGKSTFLRTVGLAAIMAQTVNTVHAKAYRGHFCRVYSSMALSDDIQSGDSYYIAEIKSLKRIMDAEEGRYPILCFIDEILRGTNTVERIAASFEILKSFAGTGVCAFAATHDIELTHMLESLYSNYHFTEEIEDGSIHFSYRLMTGRATTRNAIKLLSVMGYDDSVVKAAEDTANRFIQEGKWTS